MTLEELFVAFVVTWWIVMMVFAWVLGDIRTKVKELSK